MVMFPFQIARGASAILYVLKEYGLDLVGRLIARDFFDAMSNALVEAISVGGRNEEAAFIGNWRSFVLGAQLRGETILRASVYDATLGQNPTICQYLRGDIAATFGIVFYPDFSASQHKVDALQYYNIRNKCSLPAGLVVNNFRDDFNQGGWEAWKSLIKPENNFYGVYADTGRELARQRQLEEKIDTSEGVSGTGYTSKRSNSTDPLLLSNIITPGKLFSDTAQATIDRELDWLVSSDELEEVLVNVFRALRGRLLNFAAGAIGFGDLRIPPQEGVPSVTEAQNIAQGDCVNQCVIANCPAALPTCQSPIGPGGVFSDANACSPRDPDPRDACVSSCKILQCTINLGAPALP